MAIDAMDATDLMPLETPVLKVSRPVAVSWSVASVGSVADSHLGVQPVSKCQNQMRWETAGVLFLREKRSRGRMYQYERSVCER